MTCQHCKEPIPGAGVGSKKKNCSACLKRKDRERCKGKYYRLGYSKYNQMTEKRAGIMGAHLDKFPEKKAARIATKKGRAFVKGNHRHHWSYLPEHYTDTIELTPKAHYSAHNHLIYDSERMQYRRSDNMVLLDTKGAHIEFINSLM